MMGMKGVPQMFGTMYKEFLRGLSPLMTLVGVALAILFLPVILLAQAGVLNVWDYIVIAAGYMLALVYFVERPASHYLHIKEQGKTSIRNAFENNASDLLKDIYRKLKEGNVPVTQVKALQVMILSSLDDKDQHQRLMRKVELEASQAGEEALKIYLPHLASEYDWARDLNICHSKFKQPFDLKF